ncbi:hypothetical protein [Siminovitchia fortis]|nr:hypothetical protein [Siminovitchia fortis]
MDTPSTLGNLSSDGQLNYQKSADAIVPSSLRWMGRAEQLRENRTLGIQSPVMTTDNRKACLKEEMVNPMGDFKMVEQRLA